MAIVVSDGVGESVIFIGVVGGKFKSKTKTA